MPSVAVVTATTGRESLKACIDSVANQTVTCSHYVFVDGCEIPFEQGSAKFIALPVKTGGNGIMNGGILAASAFLVTEDIICWLDDDNTFDPEHIEELVKAKGNKPYAYSLRKFLNFDGEFHDYDDFSSLGQYSGFIDANCYLMDRDLAVKVAPNWYRTHGRVMLGDRYVYKWLQQNQIPFGESGKYTVNYLLNLKHDKLSWIDEENAKSRAKYGEKLPWRK